MSRRDHRRRGLAVLAVFTAACLASFVFLLDLAGGLGASGTNRYTAVVRDAVLLADRSDVRVAGVVKGRVEGLSVRRGAAVIELAVDDDVTLHRDATVRIGTKTPTGENYVDLDPGTPRAARVAPGETLGVSRARDAVQLDDVLSAFPPERRRNLRRLIRGLGTGVDDGGAALNDTLEGVSALFTQAGPLAEALAAQRTQVATLVDDLGVTLEALGARDAALQRLVRGGRAAAEAIGAEETSLRATLRRLPAMLEETRATAVRLGAVGTRITPVLDDLTATLTTLTPTARRLPAVADETRGALDALGAVTPRARRLLTAVRGVSPQLGATAGPVDDVLRETSPILDYLEPYRDDITRAVSNLASAADARDGAAGLVRLAVVVTDELYQGLPSEVQEVVDGLTEVGALQVLRTEFNGTPRPGRASTTGSFDDVENFRRLTRDARTLP